MSNLVEFYLSLGMRLQPDPINDGDHHQARINDARESLGQRYLCHPVNRIKPIWRGPCQPEITTA